jgi:hypothetical protein
MGYGVNSQSSALTLSQLAEDLEDLEV